MDISKVSVCLQLQEAVKPAALYTKAKPGDLRSINRPHDILKCFSLKENITVLAIVHIYIYI